MDGPYSLGADYDQHGNMTHRYGWGGEVQGGSGGQTSHLYYTYSNGKNQIDGFTYDAAGNLTNDGPQGLTYVYNAQGQQTSATGTGYSLSQTYDGDALRISKVENGAATYYLRSSVLGNQVVCEIGASGGWSRGYVYSGNDLVAVQSNGVNWVHQDPYVKSQRITDNTGAVLSTGIVEMDPWGSNTARSTATAFNPQNFTTYIRDGNGDSDAMKRRYDLSAARFTQPDPYSGSYEFGNPQSLNRYAYTKNDPVNHRDPTGLMDQIWWDFGWGFADASKGWGDVSAGFWGRGYMGGNGWGSDPNPGQRDIAKAMARQDEWIRERLAELAEREPQNSFDSEPQGWHAGITWTKCPPVQFKVTGVGPGQAPDTTALSQTPRADIPNGGVAIKPKNFGVNGFNGTNRSVFLNMRFEVDWSTASPTGSPAGIPTRGPFFPVDIISPPSVRNSAGNQIDVYNYQVQHDAWTSTRMAMVTTWIPANTAGVTCPK